MPTHIPVKNDSDTHTVLVRARPHGQSFKQFLEFKAAASEGKRVQLIGPHYVALSRNVYDDLVARARKPTVVIDEASQMPGDDMWPEKKR